MSDGAAPVPLPLSLAYRAAFALLRPLCEGYIHVHASGKENLPPPGTACIVTTNHASALDMLVAGHAIRRPARFVAKVELTRVPFLGAWVLALGAIPAQRDQRDTDVLRRALTALEDGCLLGVAPEGTRSRDGRLHDYDPGFAWLAARTGACVVPMAIHGAYRLMPPGARLPRPGDVWVRFGAQVVVAVSGRHVRRAELERTAADVRARTQAMLDDLARETGVPVPGTAPSP